jgi:hypothetical protein
MTTETTNQPTKQELRKLRTCWHHMVDRCHNPKCKAHPWYGARGITVCDEWRNGSKAFVDWALANGFKVGLTIDRRENDLGYSPDNCRFVTRSVNQQNRRKPAGSRSRFIGISKSTDEKRWQAHIQKDGQRRYVGQYRTERQAALAYDAAALEIYGPDARLNFPQLRKATA